MKPSNKPTAKVEVNPVEIDSLQAVALLVGAAVATGHVAIDTETTGLEWAQGCVAFMATFATDIHHTWLCYDMTLIAQTLRDLESAGIDFVFHNGKFDLHMLRVSCGWEPVIGYEAFMTHDTMLAFRVIDPLNSAALKVASVRYAGDLLDVAGPQKQIKAWVSGHTERERCNGKWVTRGTRLDDGTLVPPDDFNYSMIPRDLMRVYAAQDVVLTIACHIGLQADLKRLDPTGQTLRLTYDRERRLTGHLIDMELRGWPIDKDATMATHERAKVELDSALADLRDLTGEIEGLLVAQRKPLFLNPFSAPQLVKYLYKIRKFPTPPNVTDAGNPTVDEAALAMLPDIELRDTLLSIRHWKKALDKSGELIQYTSAREDWHYIHGDFQSAAARTGRMSATRPALQNISRHDEDRPWTHVRNLFKPAPGRSLVLLDWSNIEMRLFALYAQDKVLLDVFDRDGDAHKAVAGMVYGKAETDVSKMERTFAKTLSFSILYGAGVNRIYEALRYGGAGDPLTTEEMIHALQFFAPEESARLAKAVQTALLADPALLTLITGGFKKLARCLVDSYYKRFPTVRELNGLTSDSVILRWEKYGRGFVRNLFGRETLVPKTHAHIATNALIQGTSADLMKESLMRMPAALRSLPEADAHLFATIHDEVIIDCAEGHEIAIASAIRPTMISDPIMDAYIAGRQEKNSAYRRVPLRVDATWVSSDSNWAHKKDLVLP
jgi:YD repeat-containing protein